MSKVKVWNDNVFPYSENFKGEHLAIPPKSFIVMEREEAILFKGTFKSPVRGSGGNFMPEHFKMIRVEPLDNEKVQVNFYKCQACGFDAKSMVHLDKHITDNHADILLDEEERKKRTKGK